MNHGSLGARVLEGDVFETHDAPLRELHDGVRGSSQRGFVVEHLADAVGRDGGARNHHRHEARHQHAHQNQADVLHEGEDRAEAGVAVVDLDTAKPHHANDGHVEHQHRDRKEHHKQRTDPATNALNAVVRLAEALFLNALTHKRAHNTHAGELLAQHQVHRVKLRLVLAERRNHAADDEEGEDQQHGYGYGNEP